MREQIEQIKNAASGRWPEILERVGGLPAACLDGKKHPCPECQDGGTDRFRLIDRDAGAVYCNQCFKKKNGDGIAAVQWATGCSFREALNRIGEYLGLSQKAKTKPKIVAEYDYCDAERRLVFQAVRLEPKSFRQRQPDRYGGWTWNVKGCPLLPYRLPDIIGHPDAVVYIVEGEKDVENLARLGLVATCNAGGAGKWRADHAEYLRGRIVIILVDNDEAGRSHADQVARSLVGIARSIKIIQLPGLPEKGDVSDWLAAGGTVKELLRLADEAAEHVCTTPDSVKSSSNYGYSTDLLYESGRTDIANAKRFIDRYHAELIFVPSWNRWLSWDRRRWRDDQGIGVMQRAKKYADELWEEIPRLQKILSPPQLDTIIDYIKSVSQSAKITAFLRLAESDERVVCPIESLNADPMLLNVRNGTIDLRSGNLRQHDPADRITQLAPVAHDPAAQCPRWMDTLSLIFGGDAELIDYVQSLLGYSISGDVGQAIMPICYGSGNNGKSTIWNCVVEMLGDYAALANEALLLGEREGHPTEKAMLYQLRFVPISEPERGSRLRESRVKELTGDSMITARRMKEDFWMFRRTHTFWLSTNHLPKISGTDEGIWRRIKLIPFGVDLSKLVKPIPDYASILARDEGSGILNWLLAGWGRYQADQRFVEPIAVRQATAGYRADSDALGGWIDEHCIIEHGAIVTANELYERYVSTGGKWSSTSFGSAMAERFEKEKPTGGIYRRKTIYHGLRLATEDEKTSENTALSPVDTSRDMSSKNPIREPKLMEELVTTGDSPGISAQERMIFE